MQRSVQSSKRRGFTLMELLVVLAILVLLMAMVAPRVLKFLGKSDISVAKTQIGNLKKSLDMYKAECRTYPRTEQGGLNALISPPGASETGATVRGWDGPYLDGDSVPLDPWGLPYGYAFPPTRSRSPGPEIWSFGPDNMDGTEDDICSWTIAVSGSGETGMGEEGMMGQDPMGMDPMGGQLGPEGMPGQEGMPGMPPMDGGLPPMDGGMQQPGGLPPTGMSQPGMPPTGMSQPGMPPAGMSQPGGLPPTQPGNF